MKKIKIQPRGLVLGALVLSPALITVAHAAVDCYECDDNRGVCIGDANANQGTCQQNCDSNYPEGPGRDTCYGGCQSAFDGARDSCEAEHSACYVDCVMC